MTSLKEEALLLLEHRNIQERYIFLRYCFSQKINHLLRTTDLSLTEAFSEEFDFLQKIILCSLLGQYNPQSLPEWAWNQSCLPTKDGGLGLHKAFLTDTDTDTDI